MKPKFFIGIDLSKVTLDLTILQDNKVLEQSKIDNSEKAIKEFIQKANKEHGCTAGNTICCAENMGLFATFLIRVCRIKKRTLALESALRIKRSLGLQRGKSDKIDATRIARYASKSLDTLRFWKPPNAIISELKSLSSIRKRLLKIKKILKQSMKWEGYFLTASARKEISTYTRPSLMAVEKDMRTIDEKILSLIKKDKELNRIMELATSVPSIGKVIATELIIVTNGFEQGWTAKGIASYCGIAPFEWTSGTSVKGKTKVSHLAKKELKALLHMAAISILKNKKSFLAKFYSRKVKEGKHKMSVLNALRNKIIHRVFACVRDNKKFVERKFKQPLHTMLT